MRDRARKNTRGEGVGGVPVLLTHPLHWNNKCVIEGFMLNKLIFGENGEKTISNEGGHNDFIFF
ncbi:MAG: hypothetical protein A3D92_02720 [Bacteroidetes bacterium RIFCSPHIGHO2_02_FULL_44_7]|nr:MAG: hypothetical protein A3D92_02720 [Bacteroidetes bacterium RIFCSPHIGHO2_02_FULL_44_7]